MIFAGFGAIFATLGLTAHGWAFTLAGCSFCMAFGVVDRSAIARLAGQRRPHKIIPIKPDAVGVRHARTRRIVAVGENRAALLAFDPAGLVEPFQRALDR